MSTLDVDFSALADNVTESTDPITPDFDEPELPPEEDPVKRNAVKEWLIGSGETKPRKPRRSRREKNNEESPVAPRPKIRANSHPFKKPLTDLYTAVGTMIIPFDNPCGMAVVMNAEKCAIALEDLARENEAVRRALESLITTSVWGTVIAAHAPILLAISIHHVPAVKRAMTGFTPPAFSTPTETVTEESDI